MNKEKLPKKLFFSKGWKYSAIENHNIYLGFNTDAPNSLHFVGSYDGIQFVAQLKASPEEPQSTFIYKFSLDGIHGPLWIHHIHANNIDFFTSKTFDPVMTILSDAAKIFLEQNRNALDQAFRFLDNSFEIEESKLHEENSKLPVLNDDLLYMRGHIIIGRGHKGDTHLVIVNKGKHSFTAEWTIQAEKPEITINPDLFFNSPGRRKEETIWIYNFEDLHPELTSNEALFQQTMSRMIQHLNRYIDEKVSES